MSDTIYLGGLDGLADTLDRIQRDFPDMVRASLEDAFLNTGILEDIWRRTPKSERAKYGERYGVSKRDGSGLKKGWRSMVTPEEAEQLDSYGLTRLANSLLPSGVGTGLDQLGFRRNELGWSFSITSSTPYAAKMHETDKPAEGDYWIPGNGGHGWSTAGTGNKYIEKNIDADKIGRTLAESMARRLK